MGEQRIQCVRDEGAEGVERDESRPRVVYAEPPTSVGGTERA